MAVSVPQLSKVVKSSPWKFKMKGKSSQGKEKSKYIQNKSLGDKVWENYTFTPQNPKLAKQVPGVCEIGRFDPWGLK